MAFSLKDYQITGEIGQGGFASVYRAKQKSLSREVAIKRLSPQRTQIEADIVRFRREAEAMASLTHDNIVTVYDYAYYNGSYYIVMEFIDGPPLDKAIEGGLPSDCALLVLEKVAGALHYSHSQNIIHRDIKPANILLGRNGRVKLADFGLALFQTGIESYSSPAGVLGTISYMAPEALVSPKDVDARIDVFSLGCLLYQACSGNLPFRGDSFGEISFHLLNDEPVPLAATGVFQVLGPITMRCLQKDREKRPAMSEIHRALKETLGGRYHAAQEALITFVNTSSSNASRGGQPQKSPEALQPQNVPLAAPRLKKNTVSRLVITSALICLVIVTAFFGFYFSFPQRPSKTPPLPELPRTGQASPFNEAEKNAPTTGPDRPLAIDGPAPLAAGSNSGMKVAKLELKGLLPDDTVFLNNRKKPHDSGLMLAPGHYRLDLRRKTGVSLIRDLELLPYERQVIDLRKERTGHGGK
jgi:eukaryotic-like serine/threonine-protein kinase